MKSYGITENTIVSSREEEIFEELKLNGFSVVENYLSPEKCEQLAARLEQVYTRQEKEFGRDNLIEIQELDMCRMPFLYDHFFTEVLSDEWVTGLFEKFINGRIILHLQNGIINRPSKEHHQTSWHRDLPYQSYVVSEPIGLNAFYCLTDFNAKNGATVLLPFSHRMEKFPSLKYVEKHAIQVEVPKGSLLLFDSFVYHRAGTNSTDEVRYGLNHLYVRPLLKQQVDIAGGITDWSVYNERQQGLLGKNFTVPRGVSDFRKQRQNKSKR